jgi:hypothetical protein
MATTYDWYSHVQTNEFSEIESFNLLERTHELGPISAEICPEVNNEAKRNKIAILQRGRLSG